MNQLQREALQLLQSAARLAKMTTNQTIVTAAAHTQTSEEMLTALDRIEEAARTVMAQSVERKADRQAEVDASMPPGGA